MPSSEAAGCEDLSKFFAGQQEDGKITAENTGERIEPALARSEKNRV